MAKHYTDHEKERFVRETHSSTRSDFARDRGRLLHSSALRRLAAKTQVLSPTAGLDFARNRLTHSLEVAQIGRELANRLGVDADVVETACLAHDIGHPPFGHNGERALAEWAQECGGFEGNAQTLRVLTRLEPKVFDTHGASRGLNLTRASLLASIKYPWGIEDADSSGKFGVYADDLEVFHWAREGLSPTELSVEASIMDFSDDVAYSVHDFEDAIVNGFLRPESLEESGEREKVAHHMQTSWSEDSVHQAWERLGAVPGWVTSFSHSRRELAQLKNLTSTLIGRFAESATLAQAGQPEKLDVSGDTRAEIAVLKGIVSYYVMYHTARQPLYVSQRRVLEELASSLFDHPEHLDGSFADDWHRAKDDAAKKRVIVDQVASLTDQSALGWHERLCG